MCPADDEITATRAETSGSSGGSSRVEGERDASARRDRGHEREAEPSNEAIGALPPRQHWDTQQESDPGGMCNGVSEG